MATLTKVADNGKHQFTLTATEGSVSSTNNTSAVTFTFTVEQYNSTATWSGWGNSVTYAVNINGTTYSGSIPEYSGGTVTLKTGSQTIAHNDDGSKSITIGFTVTDTSGFQYCPGDATASSTMALTTISRYATLSIATASKTETTLNIKWTADVTCDVMRYSTDGGTTWSATTAVNATTGTVAITGLTAGTSYAVRIRVRMKASGNWTGSSTLTVSTYDYPYPKTAPDFTLGNVLKITLYNPLKRSCTVTITANGTTVATLSTTTTAVSTNTANTKSTWYATIPNQSSATYSVTVTYSGNTSSSVSGTYTANANDSDILPTYTTATYQDVNPTTLAMTGNSQLIVQNKSTVFYQVSGLAAQYGATLTSAYVIVNGVTTVLTISGTTATGTASVIDSGSNVEASIYIYDSRGSYTIIPVTITMLAWSNPTAVVTAERQYNFYSNTYLKAVCQWTDINGNNTIHISYTATSTAPSSPVSGTLSNDTQGTATLDNNYSWTITFTITDDLGGSSTFTASVGSGVPLMFWDRNLLSVGINCFPTDSNSLFLNGNKILEPNIAMSMKTGNTSSPTTGANTNLALGTHVVVGSRLTAASSGITIGDGIDYVKVSATLCLRGATSSAIRYARITQNGTVIAEGSLYMLTSTQRSNIVVLPRLIAVSSGDVFRLQYYTAGGAIYGDGTAACTYLCVEAVG